MKYIIAIVIAGIAYSFAPEPIKLLLDLAAIPAFIVLSFVDNLNYRG